MYPCVDTSIYARFFLTISECDQVQSCVRPLKCGRTHRGPVWRCADQVQIGLASLKLSDTYWFSRSSLVSLFRTLPMTSSHCRLYPSIRTLFNWRRTPAPDSSRFLSSSPISCGPSYSPMLLRPAYAACALSFAIAMSWRPPSCGMPNSRRTLPQ